MPPKLAKNHLLSKTGLRHSSHENAQVFLEFAKAFLFVHFDKTKN